MAEVAPEDLRGLYPVDLSGHSPATSAWATTSTREAVHEARLAEILRYVAEASVVRVVHAPQHGELVVTGEAVEHGTGLITLVRASPNEGCTEESTLLTRLDSQVNNRLLVAVREARHAGGFTLPVHDLHLIYEFGRQVVKSYLGVALEETFAVYHDLRDGLAIDRDLSFLIDTCPRELLEELYDRCSLLRSVAGGIILEGVALDDHFVSLGYDIDVAEDLPILFERDLAQLDVLVSDLDRTSLCLVADEGDAQGVGALSDVA